MVEVLREGGSDVTVLITNRHSFVGLGHLTFSMQFIDGPTGKVTMDLPVALPDPALGPEGQAQVSFALEAEAVSQRQVPGRARDPAFVGARVWG